MKKTLCLVLSFMLLASLAVLPLLAVVLRRPGPRDYTELPEFRAIVGDYVL